ncbi:four-carbon acid sugar kinase family protein [Cellulomonas sp. Y8]|uniref:four-carbon acid sugar kinase family protein n=1 Tax=Cellulomonas sp. Y8 TaxID=2591145 RepID=UPI003D7478F1
MTGPRLGVAAGPRPGVAAGPRPGVAAGPRLGVVADDVTGACDLADAVRDAGGSAVVVLGAPAPGLDLPPCDAAVVALRTRTAPAAQAVAESVAAASWLRDRGASAVYQKYCSTFDSTDDGTIGPVADALLDLLGPGAVSVGTPATPRAGRTQYQGHLFVGDRLLSESPLRHHPLTPMTDPDLVRVLGRQTPRGVGLLPWGALRGPDAGAALARVVDDGVAHVLVDALTDEDLDALARVVGAGNGGGGAAGTEPARIGSAGAGTAGIGSGAPRVDGRPVLLGGAAGFAAALARSWASGAAEPADVPAPRASRGRALIVSGSCSARTREQVDRFPGPRVPLDADALAADPDGALAAVLDALRAAYADGPGPVLVSSSADPDAVRGTQERLGVRRAAAVLERTAGEVAARAVRDLGVGRLLVAGGETSGAVASALGLGVLRVGPAAAPGAPWMVPVDGPAVAVLLKSGNFGDPDLFTTAWEACP